MLIYCLRVLFFLLLFLVFSAPHLDQVQAEEPWQELQVGLDLATEHELCEQGAEPCAGLVILRIDPEHYQLLLLSASEPGQTKQTLKGWAQEYHLQAVINAGMFWEDLQTSAGYMKNFEHVNNKIIHPEYNSFLVFNPVSSDLPFVQLIDRKNQSQWEKTLEDYQSVVQSYRMISSQGKNVWERNSKSYSVACVGLDQEDRVLFIFSEQPRTIHDLNNILLDLPLGLQSCMFMEGGPTAGLYVNAGTMQRSWQGASESTLWSKKPGSFIKVPNALGITKRKE
ncbi:MAG: phosphodiester glycosidase family protein [Desulfohalobiaceae bacterium]